MKRLFNLSLIGLFLVTDIYAISIGGDVDGDGLYGSAGMAGPGASSKYVNLFTGSASYSVPIEVPPGRKGIQPDISLVYNSGGGNGLVGVGWNVTGMNCIWRSTKWGVPKYNNPYGGEFLINGVSGELVLLNWERIPPQYDCNSYCSFNCGAVWQPGWQQCTETEINASCLMFVDLWGCLLNGFGWCVMCRIEPNPGQSCIRLCKSLEGNISRRKNYYRAKIESFYLYFTQTVTNNQDTWEVRDKNGTLIYFSSDPNKRIGPDVNTANGTYKWCADYVEDKNGNRMIFSYLKDNGEIYPESIVYTGNTVTQDVPKQKVQFFYEDRNDAPINYRAGFYQKVTKRVKEIRTYTSADSFNFTLVKRYILNYTYSSDSSRSLLSSVKEYGKDAVTALPAINFSYTVGTSGYSWVSSNIPRDFLYHLGSTYTFDLGSRLLEINGDGFTDIVDAWCGGIFIWPNTYRPCNDPIYTYIYLNQKNNNNPFGNGQNNIFPRSITLFPSYTDLGVRVLDINGDGKDDIIKAIDGVRETFLGTGNGWVYAPQYNLPVDFVMQLNCAGQQTGQLDNGVRFGDVNGDGLVDIIHNRDSLSLITYPMCGQPRKADIYINTRGGWQKQENALLSVEPFVVFRVADPLWFSSVYTVSRGENISDINGDGLSDILLGYRNSDGLEYKRVYLNRGGSWSIESSWTLPETFIYFDGEGKPHDRGVRLTDINFDGLVDIIQSVYAIFLGIEKIYLNNGHGWTLFASNSYPTYFPTYFNVLDKDMGVRFGDINGDGISDVVEAAKIDGGEIKNIWIKNGPKPDLLTTITNGIGGTITINYGHSNQFDNTCANGVYNGIPDLPYAVPVVTSITVDDGRGWQSSSSYWYECGKYDSQEREFMGFGHVRVTDAEGNYSDNYFSQDDIYAGRPTKTEVRAANGALYTIAVYQWGVVQPYVEQNLYYPYIPYVVYAFQCTYDGDSSYRVTGTYTTIDNYGNPTGIYNFGECPGGTCNFNNGDEVATVISYVEDLEKGIVGLPKEIITSGFTWVTKGFFLQFPI